MIRTQLFGNTGHSSTRALFGAAALGGVTQAEADQTLELLVRYGVNHIDTAASYGDAELRIGPWMPAHRSKFFLATKTGERTYAQARDQIRASLQRLQVEQIDLIQLHNLVDPDEWETAMGADGALKAAIEARKDGLVRFIGVTGHGLTAPAMHLRALERFEFDSVLLPWNYVMAQNSQYRADFERLLAVCQERRVAVQTIKSIARGPIGDKPHVHAVWYDPLTDDDAIRRAVQWVLGHPALFVNTAGDIHLLPKVLEAAQTFQTTPSDDEMRADIEQLGITPLFTA
jgi:aryl-alcohol dehydrogenase-like predicted oxidoreductase